MGTLPLRDVVHVWGWGCHGTTMIGIIASLASTLWAFVGHHNNRERWRAMRTKTMKQQQQPVEGWQQARPQRGCRNVDTAGKQGSACWHGILLFYCYLLKKNLFIHMPFLEPACEGQHGYWVPSMNYWYFDLWANAKFKLAFVSSTYFIFIFLNVTLSRILILEQHKIDVKGLKKCSS